jgi:putative oxidoreductase
MKRLFSVFPSGAAGAALLLLRLSAASLMAAMIYLNPPPLWLSACAGLIAVALLIGLFTQFAAALCAVFVTLFFLKYNDSPNDVVIVLHAADALALALLGPGAYSIDAYLFGRRVIQF